MDSLFKLIFYLIIIIFWALNNTKKQRDEEQNLPIPPKSPPAPLKKQPQEPSPRQPAEQDISNKSDQPSILPEISVLDREQILQMRLRKTKTVKKKHLKEKPVTKIPPKPEIKTPEAETELALVLKKKTKKTTLCLKSSIKEGIIWSIILGPPRSRVRFNRKSFPI